MHKNVKRRIFGYYKLPNSEPIYFQYSSKFNIVFNGSLSSIYSMKDDSYTNVTMLGDRPLNAKLDYIEIACPRSRFFLGGFAAGISSHCTNDNFNTLCVVKLEHKSLDLHVNDKYVPKTSEFSHNQKLIESSRNMKPAAIRPTEYWSFYFHDGKLSVAVNGAIVYRSVHVNLLCNAEYYFGVNMRRSCRRTFRSNQCCPSFVHPKYHNYAYINFKRKRSAHY